MALLVAALFLSSLSVTSNPVQAATFIIDLEIDDGYDTPFALEDLRPGDRGSKVVSLRNVGTEDGQIAIWVSDMEETDGGEDGAHLDDYMRFEVSVPELSSNLRMPCSIRDMPSSIFGSTYIWVLNVRAGEAVEVTWYWEFLENYQPQNEAQGDGLRFTINYLLGVMAPPSQGMSWLEVDVLGQVTTALLDEAGRAMEEVRAMDTSKSISLGIPEGASCISENGTTIARIEVSRQEGSAAMDSGRAQIGPLHAISALDSEGNATRTFLDELAVLRVNYDSALLPSITRSIGLYLRTGASWNPLSTAVDEPSYIGQCAGLLNRTGETGIIAVYDPQESAYFLPSDLAIQPSEQTWWDPIIFASRVGDWVQVSVILTNIGEVSGTKNVTLAIDGMVVRSEQVVLGPLERREVTFEVSGLSSGEHAFEVSGLSGHVMVGTHINWWLIVLFIFLCVATVVGTAFSASSWKEMRTRVKHLHGNVMDVESKLLRSEMAYVAMRERQKATPVAAAPIPAPVVPAPSAPDPLLDAIEAALAAPPVVEEAFDPAGGVAAVALAQSKAASAAAPIATEAPAAMAVVSRAPTGPSENALDELQQQEDIEARKLRVAKGFILLTIQSKGQLAIDQVPRSKSAEMAMKALGQLIDEGKIRAIQQEHRVIYVMNP